MFLSLFVYEQFEQYFKHEDSWRPTPCYSVTPPAHKFWFLLKGQYDYFVPININMLWQTNNFADVAESEENYIILIW